MAAGEVVVRACRREEVAAVLELWAGARSGHAVSPDDPAAAERLAADGALLVAEEADRIVGALIAAWDGWRGNMYRLAVRPERRRRGIALALVRAGEERLRSLGAGRVTALVAREDDVAGALWDAAGYERDRAVGRFVRNL